MFLLLAVLFPLLLTLNHLPASSAQEVSTPASWVTLQLSDQRQVWIDSGQPLALSPDGRWLAGWRNGDGGPEVCAFLTETLTEESCASFPGESIASASVAWSPDGMSFAFTDEDMFVEPDLWVLDVEAGTVTNLTDDGQDDKFSAPPGTPADLAPAWSPDGTEIVFARSVREGESEKDEVESTTLQVISANGGEPREVLQVAEDQFAVRTGVRWLSDGTVLYSLTVDSGGPENGLWTVDVAGGDPRQIVSAAETGSEETVLVAVSSRGQAMLRAGGNFPSFSLIDLETGQLVPLKHSEPATIRVVSATFSPDGRQVLFVAGSSGSSQLIVRDLATNAEQNLGELQWPLGSNEMIGGLTWAANDLAFGPGPANSGVLLRLESE